MMAKRLVSILGDSISTFAGCNPAGFRVYYEGERCEATGVRAPADTWWAQVIDGLGGELLANASFSGSMVEGAGFPAGNSDERVAALSRDGVAPEVVLVFIGINDYGWGGAAAQAAGRGNALPVCLGPDDLGEAQVAGVADARAAELFEGAYESMLARIHMAYPTAEVWCCTLCPGRVTGSMRSTFEYRHRGIAFDRYNDAIRASAKRQGCQLADVRAFGRDYDAIDGTHPTALGMKQFAAMVLRAMSEAGGETLLHEAPGEKASVLDGLLQGAPRSECTCDEPSCIGCPYARSTGNAWFLVCERP